jgi:hypothetical protein
MMDLSNMSLGDLRNLQEQIKQEMKKREHQEVQKAREQILAIAQSVGVPLKDLISSGPRRQDRGKTGWWRYRFGRRSLSPSGQFIAAVDRPRPSAEMGQGMGRRR